MKCVGVLVRKVPPEARRGCLLSRSPMGWLAARIQTRLSLIPTRFFDKFGRVGNAEITPEAWWKRSLW